MRTFRPIFAAILVSLGPLAQGAAPIPKTAVIVEAQQKFDRFIGVPGDVRVVFSDRHTELLTHEQKSRDVRLSRSGLVGWIHVPRETLDAGRMMLAGKELLLVRLPSGQTKRFPPYDENVAILGWQFADDDKTIVLRSMGHHGPSSFVQYSLRTGKIIDAVDSFSRYDRLPAWAKVLAYPD